MKVLIIGPFFPPVSGVSTANETLLEGLSEYLQVDSINMGYPEHSEDLGKFSIKKAIRAMRSYWYIYKVALSDVVYMTPGQTFYGILKYSPFILFSKLFGKKAIVHVHGDHVWREFDELKGIKKKAYSTTLSLFDEGIVLSESLRKNLRPFLPEQNISVINNFVEEDILGKLVPKTIVSKDLSRLNILFLSNLMEQKGTTDLLRSLLILKRKGIEFKAVFAGEIDARASKVVNSLLDELKAEVSYKGVVRGEAKLNLLAEANVFVLPTYYAMEGQPIALLEAMAAGNTILTTQHAGIPDIFVQGRNGFYVRKQDPDDIAEKLILLSKTLPDRIPMMKNNHEEAKTFYTVEKFVRSVETLIKK